jgi:hypothetical protein
MSIKTWNYILDERVVIRHTISRRSKREEYDHV